MTHPHIRTTGCIYQDGCAQCLRTCLDEKEPHGWSPLAVIHWQFHKQTVLLQAGNGKRSLEKLTNSMEWFEKNLA